GIDTGSLYTFIPEDRLEGIGIEPSRTREFTLADGRRDRRLLGEALITLRELNETTTNPVVFGPRDSLYLIGAVTLETFAVEVDPATRELKPITAIIGAHFDSR
ncbi:MAG: Retroviral aspartyl protease, partial [Bacteroidetes bacterium]|nr:Retroviral aspartyl protease [Bacteroidota bacterium]